MNQVALMDKQPAKYASHTCIKIQEDKSIYLKTNLSLTHQSCKLTTLHSQTGNSKFNPSSKPKHSISNSRH